MVNKTNILIKQLILVGYRKNYLVPFHPGVNIIYGDSTTGKSTILELINYLLGSSKFDTYDEIETAVRYAALELELNGKTYVIKRDIFDSSKFVEVYEANYGDIDKVFPEKYTASYGQKEAPSGYLSDFLLDSMGFPNVKVRRAPTQTDTKMVQLSFRDIFKYCYLNQEDIGSKHLLDVNNWAVNNKNKQTFKYLFNLLDSSITSIEHELADLSVDKRLLESKYNAVSDFLRDTEFKSLEEIYHSSDELDQQIEVLEEELNQIKQNMVANSDKYHALKEILLTIQLHIKKLEEDRSSSENAIERYTRLKNDYLNDIEKIKAIELAKDKIGNSLDVSMSCPICNNDLSIEAVRESFQVSDNDKLNHELNILKRRVKDLIEIIKSEKDKYKKATTELYGVNIELNQARRMLDEESIEMITPYLTERDAILSKLATLTEKRGQTDITLKIRNQEEKIATAIVKNQNKIDILKEKLQELQEKAPSLAEVTTKLGETLDGYLEKVNVKNRVNIGISQSTYLPIVRGKNYIEITSGGLRTITSIGHFVGFQQYSLDKDMNLPRLLMIDTVGKYLGKTEERYFNDTDIAEDGIENISDPSKYKNIYEYLINMSEMAEQEGKSCQIILVDNDVPPSIQKEYAGFVIAHYSSSGEGGLPIGLIDDADVNK